MVEIVSFGEWLQTRRNQLGLTRTGLAQKVGCSPVTIKKIERDERRPSIQIAELLAQHLQIPKVEQEDFIRRARGEFVARFGSPEEMTLADVQSPKTTPKHNLPTQPTPFIGREAELAALAELLANPDKRLVTIVGPGGMGKTRLSVALAESQLTEVRFANGIYFVALAPLSEPEHIVPALAEAMDFPLDSGGQQRRTAKQQVLDYLRQKQMLLVLDNFEHLLPPPVSPPKGGSSPASLPPGGIRGGEELVADILQAAARVQVLATSRERLHLHEEQVYPIQGLEFPEWETPQDAERYTAVRLFIQSAQRIQPDFRLQADDLTYLSRICRLVGGMPLAVELAAGWVDMLSLADIATEIQQNLDFLETDVRNVPDRHRSMRAVFDASWQRLSDDEQAIFPQLSVFRGGFTRQAGQTIVGASLRLLGRLVSKSLLQYDRSRDRYQIHELLRQFAAEKLVEHDEEKEVAVRSQHSVYYLKALHERLADLQGKRQQAALAEIEADFDNVRAAWRWAVQTQQVEWLAGAMDCLGYFLEWNGRYQDGEQLFAVATATLTGIETAVGVRTQAILLGWQSYFSNFVQEDEFAVELCERSLKLLRHETLQMADTRHEEAFILYQMGRAGHDYDLKKAALEKSLPMWRELDNAWGIANTLQILGEPDSEFGSLEEIGNYLEECLTLRRGLGDRRGIAHALILLSTLSRYQGALVKAEPLAQEALQICRELGVRSTIGRGLFNLGMSLSHIGKFDEAGAAFQEAAELNQELGEHYWLRASYYGLGGVALDVGDMVEARRQYTLLNNATPIDSGDVRNKILLGLVLLVEAKYDEAVPMFAEELRESRIAQNDLYTISLCAWLALAEHGRQNIVQARQWIHEALQRAVSTRHYMAMTAVFPGLSLLFSEQGDLEHAIELDALLRQDYPRANKDWFDEVIRRPFTERIAHLSPQVIEAAQERGRQLDWWQTAESLLAEITALGWGEEAGEQGSGGARVQGGVASFTDAVGKRVRNNLPPQTTPFIGREAELAEIAAQLAHEDCRLLTILGAGGMGKTRLGIAAAAVQVAHFAEGVTYVALAPVSPADAAEAINPLAGALADALNISFHAQGTPEEQLLAYLSQREMLLVFDNFEHLLDTAVFLSDLLAHAPHLKILTTSRERLGLQEEWLLALEGLTFPQADSLAKDEAIDTFSAVQLFAQRAQQVKSSFNLEAELPDVLRICQLVGGMPLGLELAAAWVRQLSCAAIAQEIEAEIDFLTTRLRNVPERHRSIRAVFGYSWQLLSAKEQAVLPKLSVFRGGFEREAAQAVAGASLILLSGLVDKSLLSVGEDGRYHLHELLRQFAAEKLVASSDENKVQALHGRYFLTFLAEQEPRLKGPEGVAALEAIERDIDNVRTAVRWAIKHNCLLFDKSVGFALWLFYDIQGWFREGETIFHLIATELKADCAATHSEQMVSTQCLYWAQCHAFLGTFQWRLGRLQEAEETLRQCLPILPTTDSTAQWARGWCLAMLGVVAFTKAELTKATKLFDEGNHLLKASGDSWTYAVHLISHDQTAQLMGNYEKAQRLVEEAGEIFSTLDSEIWRGYILGDLGRLAAHRGELEQAQKYHQAALQQRSKIGTQTGVAFTLADLGFIARLQGKHEIAHAYYEQSIAVADKINMFHNADSYRRELGNLAMANGDFASAKRYFQVDILSVRLVGGPGWAALGLGEIAEAKRFFQAALQKMLDTDAKPLGLDGLVGMAHVQAQEGQFSQALASLSLVRHHPASNWEIKEKVRQLWEALTAELPSELVTEAEARGRELDLWETAESLLTEPD